MIRAFIGLGFPPGAQRAIAGYADSLRGTRVRLVPPENFHVTLAFIGRLDESLIPDLTDMIREAAATIAPFELVIGGIGSFPGRKGRTVYAAIDRPPSRLYELNRALRAGLTNIGIDFDRKKLLAHVTLARNVVGLEIDEDLRLAPIPVLMDEVNLYRSDQTESGVRYTSISAAAFT
jgi:2'-5' RNA ligase